MSEGTYLLGCSRTATAGRERNVLPAVKTYGLYRFIETDLVCNPRVERLRKLILQNAVGLDEINHAKLEGHDYEGPFPLDDHDVDDGLPSQCASPEKASRDPVTTLSKGDSPPLMLIGSTAKVALLNFNKRQAITLTPAGVRAQYASFGPEPLRLWVCSKGVSPGLKTQITERIPLGRLGLPKGVASIVLLVDF